MSTADVAALLWCSLQVRSVLDQDIQDSLLPFALSVTGRGGRCMMRLPPERWRCNLTVGVTLPSVRGICAVASLGF
jgi:hypothetical protein